MILVLKRNWNRSSCSLQKSLSKLFTFVFCVDLRRRDTCNRGRWLFSSSYGSIVSSNWFWFHDWSRFVLLKLTKSLNQMLTFWWIFSRACQIRLCFHLSFWTLTWTSSSCRIFITSILQNWLRFRFWNPSKPWILRERFFCHIVWSTCVIK